MCSNCPCHVNCAADCSWILNRRFCVYLLCSAILCLGPTTIVHVYGVPFCFYCRNYKEHLFCRLHNCTNWRWRTGANESSKQSKSEKKSHQALLKLGMKPITGVSRVTINRTKNVGILSLLGVIDSNLVITDLLPSTMCVTVFQMMFCISKPDVFKSPNFET